MKKILTILLLCGILVSVAFAQRTSRSGGYSGRRTNRQRMVVDLNGWKDNLPMLPKITGKEQPRSKKTLEDRVDELEDKVIKLERSLATLKGDYRILDKRFREYKIFNSKEAKAIREEAERKKNMTQEERDRAMGYYPFFPELVYGPKENSDDYTDGYTDGYNDAYEYEEDYSWIDSWIDSEIESEEVK